MTTNAVSKLEKNCRATKPNLNGLLWAVIYYSQAHFVLH